MIRWAFDVIRITVALAINSVRLRRAEGMQSTSTECMICGAPRPPRAGWIHTCDDCLSDPVRAMEHYRRRKETTSS